MEKINTSENSHKGVGKKTNYGNKQNHQDVEKIRTSKQNSHKSVGKKTNYGNMTDWKGCDKISTQAWNRAELVNSTKQGKGEERAQYQNNAKNYEAG